MKALYKLSEKIIQRFSLKRCLLMVLLASGILQHMNAQSGIKSRSKVDEAAVSFNIFPNPNAGKFAVVVKDVEEAFHINIYNLIGEMVYHWESNGTTPANLEINLSKQPKGVYLIELDTERANLIKKVLIDHEKGS